METKKESLAFPRSDFFVTYPFFISEWESFQKELRESGIWKAKTDCSRQNLKNMVNSYLGEDKALDFPIREGLAFIGRIQDSKNPALSTLSGSIAFRDAKGAMLLSSDEHIRTFWPEFEIVLHITPSRHGGIAYLQLSTGNCSIEEAVRINYTLQKCDPDQISTICSLRDGKWVTVEGRSTLAELFDALLPKGITPMNDARFLMATNVGVLADVPHTDNSIEDALVRLGMVKDWKYKLDESECSRILKAHKNIWSLSSHEGFAVVYLTPDIEKERFLKDFHGRFQKSYLPLYLLSVMAELTYLGAIRNPDHVASVPEESDRIRETNLVLSFEVSHYTHLNKLMASLSDVWHFDKKYEIILSNIGARIAQIDAQRLQLEKDNQRLALQKQAEAEAAQKQQEAAEAAEARRRDERDREISFLLGFIGIGQVVFAILQLIGAEAILGNEAAGSQALKIISIVLASLFSVMIFYLIIKAFQKKK